MCGVGEHAYGEREKVLLGALGVPHRLLRALASLLAAAAAGLIEGNLVRVLERQRANALERCPGPALGNRSRSGGPSGGFRGRERNLVRREFGRSDAHKHKAVRVVGQERERAPQLQAHAIELDARSRLGLVRLLVGPRGAILGDRCEAQLPSVDELRSPAVALLGVRGVYVPLNRGVVGTHPPVVVRRVPAPHNQEARDILRELNVLAIGTALQTRHCVHQAGSGSGRTEVKEDSERTIPRPLLIGDGVFCY